MATAPDGIIIKLVDPISPGTKNKQRTHQHKGGIQRYAYSYGNIYMPSLQITPEPRFQTPAAILHSVKPAAAETIKRTPTAKTRIVTRDEVAMEIVEMISFSGVPVFAPTMSRALTAHGIFILIRLPVINARYPPPEPSIGV